MSSAHPAYDEPEPRNPERRGVRKGLYLIPSAFTAANIGMGFYAVMSALRGFQFVGTGVEADLIRAASYLDASAIAIGIAVLCDMLDGRIARMTKTTTEIGVQLDSIADVVTFGLAPAVLAYVWGYGASLQEGSAIHRMAWFLSFMYLMCGAFRLARFNVQSTRPRILAAGTIKGDKKSFVGLPIPVAGGLIAALIHFAPTPLLYYGPQRSEVYAILLMTLVGLLSVLMVSTLRFPSFKNVGSRKRSMRTIILVVAVGMLILLYSKFVLLGLAVAYILHGLLSRVVGMFRHRTDIGDSKAQPKEI